ncbi:MAG: DEAD/DEAH box helicase [Leptospiraceae bacterium]|nr:DEAD/DEAH box helicase [Leptospiraceae bacterium]
MHNNSTFAGLGISPITLLALEQKGFTEPTPIQAEVIPKVLTSDVDIIAKARTGTGKTAAFGIPLLELCEESAGFVQSLILTPTRELALQVCNEIESFRGKRRHQLAPVYGGQAIRPQIMALKKNPAIVVGTPGRVLDHVRGKRLNLSQLKFLVLDEADEMLDMGFQEDLEAILSSANEERRTLLFSATMPDRLRKIAQGYMKNTVTIQVKAETKEENRTERIAYEVHASDKPDALARILEFNPDFFGIIFCRTKMDTDELARNLQQRGFISEALHGDLSQAQREKILRWFKNSQRGALVATDVAARGIDISNLTHVVNYAVPDTAEALTHRIGKI